MVIIAHRANLNGSGDENSPTSIHTCLGQGLQVEVDVWLKNGLLYTGHDEPTYEFEELVSLREHVWFHAKNLEALLFLSSFNCSPNYFWHQSDDFTLTSHGYFWTYPGKPTTSKSVLVIQGELPEVIPTNVFGICTDYPLQLQKRLNENRIL